MNGDESALTAEEQAAFDRLRTTFRTEEVGPSEPHTDQSRAHYERLFAVQTESAKTLLEEADEVLDDKVSSWRAVDLRDVVLGSLLDEPSILIRDDDKALFYGGKRNAIFGAYESGKTFVSLFATREVLASGRKVVWIDFEDNPGSVAGRLLALGADDEAVFDWFRYVQPTEPLDEVTRIDLQLELHGAALVVIDGVNEAMAAASLDPNKNPDVARWYTTIPRLATEAGATLITIDHVAKDPQSQRGAVGGAHKIAGIDGAAYKVEVVVPFGRDSSGVVRLRLEKGRPGWIRGAHPGKTPIVAEISFDATDPDGSIAAVVQAPARGEETWRPTTLMQQVSMFIEEQTKLASQRQILDAVRGKRDYKIQAIAALVSDGYVTTADGTGGATLHTSTKPYREAPE